MAYKEGGQVNKYIKKIYNGKNLTGKSVLCIGSGLGANAKFLRSLGASVSTIDIDSTVNPDILCDVRDYEFEKHSYDIILCLNVLQFLLIKDIKKILPKILNSGRIIFIQMFDSPVVSWINEQLDDFKVLKYEKWKKLDLRPRPHTHTLVFWGLKKE